MILSVSPGGNSNGSTRSASPSSTFSEASSTSFTLVGASASSASGKSSAISPRQSLVGPIVGGVLGGVVGMVVVGSLLVLRWRQRKARFRPFPSDINPPPTTGKRALGITRETLTPSPAVIPQQAPTRARTLFRARTTIDRILEILPLRNQNERPIQRDETTDITILTQLESIRNELRRLTAEPPPIDLPPNYANLTSRRIE